MDALDIKLDMLKEMFNIGVGGATVALNKIIKTKLMIKVPEVYIKSVNEAIELVGPADRQVLSVYIKVSDNFPSGILIMFDEDSAKKLVKLSMASLNSENIDELIFISVLKEIANIMSSYFLNNFSQFIKMPLSPGIPHFAYDMVGAIMQSIISEHKEKANDVLIVKTEIFSDDEKVLLDFLLIPEDASLKLLFEKKV